MFGGAAEVAGHRHAERGAQRRSGVAGAIRIVGALGPAEESAGAAGLAEEWESIAEKFSRVLSENEAVQGFMLMDAPKKRKS